MIRKYHNHKPQTTQWHRTEEPLNHRETSGRQIKQSNQLSFPKQDDCNTRMDIKQRTTKYRTKRNYCSFFSEDLCNLNKQCTSDDQKVLGPLYFWLPGNENLTITFHYNLPSKYDAFSQ